MSDDAAAAAQKAELIKNIRVTLRTLLWFIGAGFFALIVYCSTQPGAAVMIGTGALVAAAAFGIGAIVGFLFSIQRTRRPSDSQPQPRYLPNTNLEDISDWLTKIIVGLGLVELGKIRD